jgi:hypothetical protein
VCAIFAALIATGQVGKWGAIIALLGGALTAFGGSYHLSNIANLAGAQTGLVQVGTGLYLTVAAGFALIVMSVTVLTRSTQIPRP